VEVGASLGTFSAFPKINDAKSRGVAALGFASVVDRANPCLGVVGQVAGVLIWLWIF
jgi:hypothetical protein